MANNLESVPKLLRAIAAAENAKSCGQDVIFSEAAKLIDRLAADLNECREYLEDCADVVDGSYGEPAPNRAMQLVSLIDETLNGRPY